MVYCDGGSTSSRLASFGFWPMLTRRIATVMISAPAASVASRVCARSLYLPLPTSRRDWYVLPAMVSRSGVCSVMSVPLFGDESTAADGAHDVHFVLRLQHALRPLLARHHAAIDGQRQRLPLQRQRIDQVVQRVLRRHDVRCAVQFYVYHRGLTACDTARRRS